MMGIIWGMGCGRCRWIRGLEGMNAFLSVVLLATGWWVSTCGLTGIDRVTCIAYLMGSTRSLFLFASLLFNSFAFDSIISKSYGQSTIWLQYSIWHTH